MLERLAQAAIHLGNRCDCFESDRKTWEAASDVIAKEIAKVNQKSKLFQQKSNASVETQKLILKVEVGTKAMTDEEQEQLKSLGIDDVTKLEEPELNAKFYDTFNLLTSFSVVNSWQMID